MKLHAANGNSFALRIVRYQFANTKGREYDDNWLVIEIDVTHPDGQWTSRDPVMLTTEVARLSKWMRYLKRSSGSTEDCEFIEPNLKFRYSDDRGVISVYFELESRPNWNPTKYDFNDDLFIESPVTELNLQAAADELDQQLLRCPGR